MSLGVQCRGGALARFGLAAGVLAAFLARAVSVRWPRGEETLLEDDVAAAPVGSDSETGALLLDLDDSTSDAGWARVRDAIARAVAPHPFRLDGTPRDELGELLSDAAELYRLTVPESEIADVLGVLAGLSDVEVVEREGRWSLPEDAAADIGAPSIESRSGVEPLDSEGFRPNDPYYRHQWHLDLVGMPRAWLRSRGEGVVVAVIDTGVAFRDEGGFARAPDLAETRFVAGYDFVDGDETPDDEHGHGTHVAGTIAQSTHNALGVAGVAPAAAIMPLRVLDRNGAGSWGAIAAAIRYATDHGAHVVNMSLGGGRRSRVIEHAIADAHRRGVVVVAAAGNTGRGPVEYPARHPHVLAVGAVRFDRQIAPYSSYGEGLDLMAPGGDLRVDQNGDGLPDGVLQNTLVGRDPRRFDYLAWQGTSMAAPHVAGAAALVRSAGISDPTAIERILLDTASPLGDVERHGAGLVRVDLALERAVDRRGLERGLVSLGIFAVLVGTLQRRGVFGLPKPALAGGVGWLLAGGLAPLTGALGTIAGPRFAWMLAGGLGPSGLVACGFVGVLAVVALSVFAALVLHHRPLARPWLVGLTIASAATLVVEAVDPSVALPAGPTAGLALALAAVALVLLARQVARSERPA